MFVLSGILLGLLLGVARSSEVLEADVNGKIITFNSLSLFVFAQFCLQFLQDHLIIIFHMHTDKCKCASNMWLVFRMYMSSVIEKKTLFLNMDIRSIYLLTL